MLLFTEHWLLFLLRFPSGHLCRRRRGRGEKENNVNLCTFKGSCNPTSSPATFINHDAILPPLAPKIPQLTFVLHTASFPPALSLAERQRRNERTRFALSGRSRGDKGAEERFHCVHGTLQLSPPQPGIPMVPFEPCYCVLVFSVGGQRTKAV